MHILGGKTYFYKKHDLDKKQKPQWEFECVVQNMRRASRLISRRYEEALRPVNLTSSQYTILQSLSGREGITHGLMAEILGFEQTTLSRLLKPLEKRQLLKVVQSPKDKRQRMACITDAGEALFAEAKTYWQKEHDKSLDMMNSKEWDTMKRVLGQLSH